MSSQPTTFFNDDDYFDNDDDENDSEPLNDVVPSDSSSPSTPNTVTLAIPSSLPLPPSPVTVTDPVLKRPRFDSKPIDDSRRLFQRLWTDEDEIELLQGFLDYTTSRRTTHHHHNDTTAFYDQIKSKLQLDFNKNQLVEKLRRLKKKFRKVLSKMGSTGSRGKDFVFKSSHDQVTFEISRKIWTNLPPPPLPPPAAAALRVVDAVDDDEMMMMPKPLASINLNSVAPSSSMLLIDHKPNPVNFDSPVAKLSTRKKPKVAINNVGGGGDGSGGNCGDNNNVNYINNNVGSGGGGGNVNLGSTMQGMIEEAVKSCLLPPMVKELVNNAVNGAVFGGVKGVGQLGLNAVPSSGGDVMDDKWRKQQILELEVYSKRLELVQEQIKLSLEELRSIGS